MSHQVPILALYAKKHVQSIYRVHIQNIIYSYTEYVCIHNIYIYIQLQIYIFIYTQKYVYIYICINKYIYIYTCNMYLSTSPPLVRCSATTPRHRQGLSQVSEDPALEQRLLGRRSAAQGAQR